MPPQTQPNSAWTPVEDSPQGWTPVDAPKPVKESKDNSMLGGFVRRGTETVKGFYNAVTAPPDDSEKKRFPGLFDRPGLIENRLAKGLYRGEKETYHQAKEQFQEAGKANDPVQKGLGYARSAVTGASMLNPLATGPVSNVNKLEDQGRNREAIGAGAFDILSLLVGKQGKALTDVDRVNRLGYAIGGEESALESALPELKNTVAQAGKPKTIGDLGNVLQDTMGRLEQKFNPAIAQMKGKIVPSDIADALEAKARTMPPSMDGQAIATQLKAAAAEYRKPWTYSELNQERMMRNGFVRGFEGKGGGAKMAAMRTNSETIIDKVVADTARDVLYNDMEKQFPGQGFRQMKQTEGALMDIIDRYKQEVERLKHAEAVKKGAPSFSQPSPVYASAHPTGVTPRMHVNIIPRRGPTGSASAATRGAFGENTVRNAATKSVLSLPLSSLATKDLPALQ